RNDRRPPPPQSDRSDAVPFLARSSTSPDRRSYKLRCPSRQRIAISVRTGHCAMDCAPMPQAVATMRANGDAPAAGRSVFVTGQAGLRLHVRAYGTRASRALPVVCLPGLARPAADFTDLALVLSSDRERLVVALDYRGRGKSDYDRNPANYNLQVELADLLTVLTALGIGRAAFVGTSRGGILIMLLAVAGPTVIAG